MSHLVERLELDIQAADEDQARRLLDRLSRLHRQALEGVIERVLDQLSPTDTVHRLETLDLDLGEIPAEQLERLLPQRLESALRRALPSRLRSARVLGQGSPVSARRHGPGIDRGRGFPSASIPASPVPAPSSAASQSAVVQKSADSLAGPLPSAPAPPASAPPSAAPPRVAAAAADTAGSGVGGGSPLLELLTCYGAGGTLPWWAPRDNPRLIPATIEAAFGLPPAELDPFLRQLASAPAARQRLFAALDPDQRPALRQALARLVPESSSQDADPPAPQPSEAPAAQRRPASQEPPQLSPQQSLQPPTQPPQSQRIPDPAAIPPSVRRSLDAPAPQPSEAPAAQRRPASQEPPQQALQPPIQPPSQGPSQVPLQGIPDPAAIPPSVRPSLDAPAPQPSEAPAAQRRSASQEPPQQVLQPPSQGPSQGPLQGISDPAAIPPSVRRSLDAPAPQPSEAPAAQRRPASQEPPQQVLQPPPQPPSQVPSQAPSQGPLQGISDPAAIPPSRRRSGDAIQVDGAGLVLLWPFLERLFERLQWLTPELRFVGALEQQRALAMLGFLVDGDPRPPEWRLSLAKVLVGLPLEAVGAPVESLSDAAMAEAHRLLQAVLTHADGRLGADQDSLRQQWLQRPGLLSRRPQAWLLAVEGRQELDGGLSGLPWSSTVIRLPWMGELVQVAW